MNAEPESTTARTIRLIREEVQRETVQECAKEACEMCHDGRPLDSPEDRMGEYFHVWEDGAEQDDETWEERYCGASAIWMRFPEALPTPARSAPSGATEDR